LIEPSQKGQWEVVRLLEASSSPKPTNPAQENLINAPAAGDLSRVKALLTANTADVNAKNANGITALTSAAVFGHLEVLQALLAAKADVNAEDADGDPALIYAS
jgi:uncharacterized protein